MELADKKDWKDKPVIGFLQAHFVRTGTLHEQG
jgi:hypothetical protein